jgi:hypothetical protein
VHNIEIPVDPALLAGGGQVRNPVDRLLMRVLREERDLPVARLWLIMTSTILPSAALLYALGRPPWWLLAAHFALVIYFFAPFILAIHVSSHRQVFSPRFRWLQQIPVWVIGPFMGQSPETYRVHHMGMHHAEGNMPEDLSSTMAYQRDRLTHFLHYYLRFFLFAPIELGLYHARRGHWRMLRQMLIGELSYFAAIVLLFVFVNPLVTGVVFVLPLVTARFTMMCGNWAQHAFVDPKDPANPYKNSIVFIDSPYNRRCFNDGYHIGHHVKPNRHWTEMPEDFDRNLDRYAAEDAIVFRGVDYFQIWLMLMTRQHGKLADRLVDWPGADTSQAAKIERIKSRLVPIPA